MVLDRVPATLIFTFFRMSKKPYILFLGPSWYGDWAKDFCVALKSVYPDSELIYTNTFGKTDYGNVTKSVNFIHNLKHRIRKISPWFVSFVKKIARYRAERVLVEKVRSLQQGGREVIVIFSWNTPPVSIIRKLRREKVRAIHMWQGECPIREAIWADSFPLFDKIFILDKEWLQYLDPKVHQKVSILHLASDPAKYYPVPVNEKFKSDIAFVGLYKAERAAVLSVLKDYDIKIYGYYWDSDFDKFPWLKEKYCGPVKSEEVNEIFNSAKIAISSLGMGFPRFPGHTTTQRPFDISLAKGFQLGDYIPLTTELFGDSIAMFDSLEDLKKKVDYYLAHPEERKRMAEKSHAIALSKHTYVHRAKELLGMLGLNG